MACINVSDLCPAGFELFHDSESFLDDLGKNEINGIEGGGFFTVVVGTINSAISLNSIATVITNTINANTIGNNNGK